MHRVSTIQRWWPALAWAGLILGMSSVPGSRLDDVGLQVPDKLVHAVEYAVLGVLALRAATDRGPVSRRAFWLAIAFAALIGVLDENYQRLVPQRESSAADWVADLVGTFAGVSLAASRFGRVLRARRRSG